MWWPLWGYNIGEFFQNSVLPIAELLAAGVIDGNMLLAPEVGGWPLRDYHIDMLRAFSRHPIRTTRQLTPRCPTAGAACPPPRCFERLLVCKFKDVYDGQPPLALSWVSLHVGIRLSMPGINYMLMATAEVMAGEL